MQTATGNAVLRAYNKAARHIGKDGAIVDTEHSAGFIIPSGQKRGEREGYQVFVRVARFSEKLLKADPMTGGLLKR